MIDNNKPIPMDVMALANLLGMKDVELLQIKNQNAMLNRAYAELQKKFDGAVDARDMPSGATKQPDQFKGD